MRLGGKTAAYANREACFAIAHCRSKSEIVDLRIGAPVAAAADADLVLAGKVVKIRIANEQLGRLKQERRGIHQFIGIHPGQRASGDIAGHVTAGGHGGEPSADKRLDEIGQIINLYPMQLNILANSDVGDTARISLREIGEGAQLMRSKKAVGKADSHHEIRSGFTFPAAAAQRSCAIALGVDSPPAEVGFYPRFRDGRVSLTGEVAYFLKALPRILFPLQPFSALCLGFSL